jgi:hypothetical protein
LAFDDLSPQMFQFFAILFKKLAGWVMNFFFSHLISILLYLFHLSYFIYSILSVLFMILLVHLYLLYLTHSYLALLYLLILSVLFFVVQFSFYSKEVWCYVIPSSEDSHGGYQLSQLFLVVDVESWYNFALSLILEIQMEELVLVAGSPTTTFTSIAFNDFQKGAQFSVEVQVCYMSMARVA